MRLLAFFVVVLCGCGKSEQQCRSDVADLGDYLQTLDIGPPTIITTTHLVTRPDAAVALPEMPVLEVLPDRLLVRGRAVDASSLAQALADAMMEHYKDPRHQTREQFYLLVAIDESTPWQIVARTAEAMVAAGFNQPMLVFSLPPMKPPPRTSVDDEVGKLAPDQKAAGIAKTLKAAIGSCKGIEPVLEEFATYKTGDKKEIFIANVSRAVIACKCSIDMPAFRSMMYHLFGQPMRGMPVTLRNDTAPVALPANATWRDASQRVAPNATTWFSVQ